MSVNSSLVEVMCDGPSPAARCPDSAAWHDYGTAAALRRRMASDGWATSLPGGVDRCPRCREAT